MRCVRGLGKESDIGYCSAQNKDALGMKWVRARSKDPQDEKWNKDQQAMAGAKDPPSGHNVTVSSDKSTVVKSALATRLATLALGKCVPEAERLVPGACDNRLAIRAHREVQDATRVACQ